jgi:MoxR-like ATPase
VSYAPAQLVLSAVASLEGAHPLAVVTLPALLAAAKKSGRNPLQGVPFGSTEESALLSEYFQPPRPPDVERPYLAPWSAQEPWQKKKYPGGGLQRMRTDASGRGRMLLQSKKDPAAGRPRDEWALTPTAGAELMESGLKEVRLVDLALWMGRNVDVDSLPATGTGQPTDHIDKLFAWFVDEFQPYQGDLVGTVYSDAIPPEYRTVPFQSQPIDETTYEQLGSLPPAPTVSGTLNDLITRIESRLTTEGYKLPERLVRRVFTAWLRGDLVILVGQPGTGKTMFASLLGRAMEAELDLEAPLLISIRADFDESEFIGYERLDGSAQLREFATSVLDTDRPLEARVVILEEFNLASIESYMASVLIASQEQERLVRLPAGKHGQLPIDTFLLATCNSFRDEPETRTRVSSPTKRRSTIITMPNVLGDRFDADPDNAVLDLATGIIETELKRVRTRTASSRAAQFDALRLSALETVQSVKDLSESARQSLVAVTAALLSTPAGRSWFTLGLLKDVVLELVHAERDEQSELRALGHAVADKLVHQVRGSHADTRGLLEACADLPNANEIELLLDRMMDGPSDELLPLL